jgi:hypothetical protein
VETALLAAWMSETSTPDVRDSGSDWKQPMVVSLLRKRSSLT